MFKQMLCLPGDRALWVCRVVIERWCWKKLFLVALWKQPCMLIIRSPGRESSKYIYVCMFICTCIHLYIKMPMDVYAFTYPCIHTYVHTYIEICACLIQTYRQTLMFAYNMHACKYIYLHTYIHIHADIHANIHACQTTYIHTYLHSCIHVQT